MPIYGVKLIKKPRDWRDCCECGHLIAPGEATIRLYGCADEGDKPGHLFIHLKCGYRVRDPRVEALLPPSDPDILTRPHPTHV